MNCQLVQGSHISPVSHFKSILALGSFTTDESSIVKSISSQLNEADTILLPSTQSVPSVPSSQLFQCRESIHCSNVQLNHSSTAN
jgi:hypothetical protein